MLPLTQPTQDQLSTTALKLRGPGAKKAKLVQCYNVFVLAKTQRKQGQLSTKAPQLQGPRAQNTFYLSCIMCFASHDAADAADAGPRPDQPRLSYRGRGPKSDLTAVV